MTKRRILSFLLVLLMMLGTVPTAVFGIFAADGAAAPVAEEAPEYSSLYVQDGLLYLWTAEGLTAGAEVTSLPNKVENNALAEGETNAIDNLIRGDQYCDVTSAFGEESGTSKVVTADGKAVAGDGFWKLDLSKFIPTTDKNFDNDATLEVLQTNLAYGNRSEANGDVNRRWLLLFAPLVYHLNVGAGATEDNNFSYINAPYQWGHDTLASSLGRVFTEDLYNPFTMTIAFDSNASSPDQTNNAYNRVDFFRDGFKRAESVDEYDHRYYVDENTPAANDRNTGAGGTLPGYRSLNYGIGYQNEAYSAIRLYDHVLSDAEMAQNHFVDICYALDIDLTGYAKASGSVKGVLHQLTVGKTASEIYKEDLVAQIAEATAERPAYNSLYVQDGLVYLWTAEGLNPGEAVYSLPNYVDGGDTAIDNLVLSYTQHNIPTYDLPFNNTVSSTHSAAWKSGRTVSADGKAVVGHGAYKYDLTKFFPNADKTGYEEENRDGDWTYEALITNVKYGADADNNATNMLLWAFTTSGKNFAEGNNFAWIDFYNGSGQPFVNVSGYDTLLNGSSLGAALSEAIGVPYTITLASDRPALITENNANWSAIYMYRDGDASTAAAGAHNYSTADINGERDGYRSFYFGPGYEEEAYSSIRLYNKKLSDAELAQNHFIDVCYMLDVDLTKYSLAKASTKAIIHELTVGKTADEFTKADLTAQINAIVAEYTVPDYYSLYVQNGLVFLWTAEGLTPGASVTSLPNLVDGGATYVDTTVCPANSGNKIKTMEVTGRTVSDDGKSVIGEGRYKYDLTKFFPNAGKVGGAEENRDGDWTYEALITNVSYGNRNFNNDSTYANMNNWLLWAKVVYGINTSLEGTNLGWYNSYTTDGNGGGWVTELDGNADMQTAMLTMLSEAEGVPYTLTLASDRPSFAEGNANWSVIYAYREATNGVSAGHNNCNTVDANGDLEGARSFVFGIGYEKEAYSAIRLYNRKLNDAEMAQNNFVDVAYMLGLNLKEYAKADAAVKAAIHQLTVGKKATDFTKDALQASVDALLAPKEEITATAADYLTFAGYQVRATSYPGLRALFNVDTDAVEASDITVKEIGAIVAKATGRTAEDLTVSLQDDGTYKAAAGLGNAALYQNGALVDGHLITREDSEGFALTVTYKTETAQTKAAYQTEFMYRGYVVVTDGSGEDHVLYLDVDTTATLEQISAIVAEDPYYAECAPIKNVLDTCASEEIAFNRGWSNAEMGV